MDGVDEDVDEAIISGPRSCVCLDTCQSCSRATISLFGLIYVLFGLVYIPSKEPSEDWRECEGVERRVGVIRKDRRNEESTGKRDLTTVGRNV